MSARDLRRTPLIGKDIVIASVKGGTYQGLAGKVIGDKMNVVIIEQNGQQKMIPKKVCTFDIWDDGIYMGQIEGSHLIGRPEKRCG